MPYYCAVADWKSVNKKSNDYEITFHRFPTKSRKLCQRWIHKCRRQDRELNPDNSRICSLHFTANDFERDLQGELLGIPLKKKLKQDAEPIQPCT